MQRFKQQDVRGAEDAVGKREWLADVERPGEGRGRGESERHAVDGAGGENGLPRVRRCLRSGETRCMKAPRSASGRFLASAPSVSIAMLVPTPKASPMKCKTSTLR